MTDNYYEKLGGRFDIQHKKSQHSQMLAPHCHEHFEIYMNLNQHMTYEINGNVYKPKYGALFFLNSMDLHFPHTDESPYERYVMYFTPGFIDSLSTEETNLFECFLFRPLGSKCYIELDTEQISTIYNMLEDISRVFELSKTKSYGSDLLLKFKVGEFLLYANDLYRKTYQLDDNKSDDTNLVSQILNYIHNNLNSDLSISTLEKEFLINKNSLNELVKTATNMSPMQYVINCRITQAKVLLMHHESVSNACFRTGFNSVPHFSKTFRKYTGMSPKQFQGKYSTLQTSEDDSDYDIKPTVMTELSTSLLSLVDGGPKCHRCIECPCTTKCPLQSRRTDVPVQVHRVGGGD